DIQYFVGNAISPTEVVHRVRGLQQAGLLKGILPVSALVLSWAAVLWVLRIAVRAKSAGTGRPRIAREESPSYQLSRPGVVLLLLVLTGWPALMKIMAPDLQLRMSDAVDPWLYVLYSVSIVALPGAAAIVVHALFAAFKRGRSLFARLGELLLVCSALYG